MYSSARTPDPSELEQIGVSLASWQSDGLPIQLHPGDLGWHSMRGPEATAAAVRVWGAGDDLAAIGLLDGPDLIRLGLDPARVDDAALAARIADDLAVDAVEARGATALAATLTHRGWGPDEPWTPLRRDLSSPVEDPGARVIPVDADRAAEWCAVHGSAFRGAAFTPEQHEHLVGGWHAMTSGPYADLVRCLAVVDDDDRLVAVAGVWTAGPGRPGLIEPMGVHADHRGHGYGVAVTRAAAATLRELGSSSAIVATESSNVAAVATYVKAGFVADEAVVDLVRVAQ